MLEKRTFNDKFNNVVVEFKTDASQRLVTGLEFSGSWAVVKEMLLDLGWTVVEIPKFNLN